MTFIRRDSIRSLFAPFLLSLIFVREIGFPVIPTSRSVSLIDLWILKAFFFLFIAPFFSELRSSFFSYRLSLPTSHWAELLRGVFSLIYPSALGSVLFRKGLHFPLARPFIGKGRQSLFPLFLSGSFSKKGLTAMPFFFSACLAYSFSFCKSPFSFSSK